MFIIFNFSNLEFISILLLIKSNLLNFFKCYVNKIIKNIVLNYIIVLSNYLKNTSFFAFI